MFLPSRGPNSVFIKGPNAWLADAGPAILELPSLHRANRHGGHLRIIRDVRKGVEDDVQNDESYKCS